MKRALILLVAGCGAGSSMGGGNPDAPVNGDGASYADAAGCTVVLAFDPANPVADAAAPVRAQARVFGGLGVPTYTWTVQAPDGTGVTTTPEALDNSQVDFIAATPGGYNVYVDVGLGTFCPQGSQVLPVSPPGAQVADYRVRVTPNALDGAPPQETIIQVTGGGDVTHPLVLDPGLTVTGQVKNGATGVPAYLRFMPVSSPTGYVEVFTDSTGHYSTRLLGQNHTVLVVPTVPGVAPAVLPWTVSTTTLNVSGGNAVSGTVKDSSGNPLAGAQLQLTHNGVPSTLATSAADGSYSVRTSLPASGPFDVHVSPPAGRGLGALIPTGVSGTTSNGPTINVQYASQVMCTLTNTKIMRGSTPLPGAHVMIMGPQNGATVGGVARVGVALIPAITDASGQLPTTVVPPTDLEVLVDLGQGDVTLTAVNSSSCSVPTIDVTPRTTVTGTVVDAAGNPLPGARIEAIPEPGGFLQLGSAPAVEATADGTGAFSIALATGGLYDVTFSDPHAHSAPLTVTRVTAAGVPTTAQLGKAIKLSGDVSVIGNANPVIGASVQILSINANASQAPIAETATTQTSTYAVGIPDPGTM